MEKIQYGIAGFFSGVFFGFLIALIEGRYISNTGHPALLFFVNVFTIVAFGIAGIIQGFRFFRKKHVKK